MIDKNSEYLKQLEIIRQIRDTIKATDEVNLPQICVIGDQSSGKSSFLSRLTGVEFPTASKMCTRAATVVTCNYDASLVKPRFEIEDPKCQGKYVEIASTAEAITERQNQLLKEMGAADNDANMIISDKAIKLRVTSAMVIDIIIVDLPGIQHAGKTKDNIDALIKANIQKPETLNLIVSEAKQDAELTKAIELAKEYDPRQERTIRVLSKFDTFDTLDAQRRAVQWINDGLSEIKVGLGPHAVISIGKDGKLRVNSSGDIEEKNQLVREYRVPESRAGILTLKDRLPPIFANLIKRSLPVLKLEVISLSEETRHLLNKVGAHAASPTEAIVRCQERLMNECGNIEFELTNKSFLSMKEKIHAVQNEITFDFASASMRMNSFQCVLFQGKEAFDDAATKIKKLWEPILNEYVKNSKLVVSESVQVLRKDDRTKIFGDLISFLDAKCK